MIRSFRCPDTELLSKGVRVKRFLNIEAVARRKLRQLEIAPRLDDLKIPPGNRVETLKGRRAPVGGVPGAFGHQSVSTG
jgi:proteic killer suppression protein